MKEDEKCRKCASERCRIAGSNNPPRPYDMSKQEEVRRWFREMEGYLRTECGGYDFLHQGTDYGGRKYALEGFARLKEILNGNEKLPKLIDDASDASHGTSAKASKDTTEE